MSKRGTIQIYTNESVNVAIAEGLRRRGINAISAKDIGNLGLRDEDQLKYALKEKIEKHLQKIKKAVRKFFPDSVVKLIYFRIGQFSIRIIITPGLFVECLL